MLKMHSIRSGGRRLRLILGALLLGAGAATAEAQSFSVTDLGTLGEGTVATAINNSGTVVGFSYRPDGFSRAFRYSDGVMTELGTLGGNESTAFAINDAGAIVGNSTAADGSFRAFRHEGGTFTDLGTLGGNFSNASGVNAAGRIVGSATTGGGQTRAFVHGPGMSDLGTLPGGSISIAEDINDAGVIAGYSGTAGDTAFRAVVFQDGTVTELGALGGSDSAALAINGAGTVVGYYVSPVSGRLRPFQYRNGTMSDLGTLGGAEGVAHDINAAGTIVGRSFGPDESERAFQFRNGSMVDLNFTLVDRPPSLEGASLTEARSINDAGQIVATASNGRSYLLDPVASSGSSRLTALSVRALAGSGDSTLIAGLVVNGAAAKPVIARAVTSTLPALGVSGVLPDPQLRLFSASAQIAFNDDWGGGQTTAEAFAAVGLAPLAPTSRDAALVTQMPPGVYTSHVTSAGGSAGVALLEIYDADPANAAARLSALSVRSFSGPGGDVLIVGVVVGGSTPKPVVIRGVGPSLGAGVSGRMSDPVVRLFDAGGNLIRQNDNWGGDPDLANAFATVGLTALPAGSADAAMIATLNPGVYTIHVSGAGTTSGVVLMELYEL